MKINHLSVSRKQLWNDCQAKYKYKYHLELPVVGELAQPLVYGSIIHKIAEEYTLKKGKKLLSEVATGVLTGKIPLTDRNGQVTKMPKLNAEYQRKLPIHLRVLQHFIDKIGFEGHIEYPFDYDLDPPNKRNVVGYIDRILIKDDKYWVIDYKTTKESPWRKKSRHLLDDDQLRLYARIIQKNFGAKAEDIKAGLFYLDGAELAGVTFSQESLDTIEKDFLKTYMDIESTTPEELYPRVSDQCRRCDYKGVCTYYSLT